MVAICFAGLDMISASALASYSVSLVPARSDLLAGHRCVAIFFSALLRRRACSPSGLCISCPAVFAREACP